MPSTLITILIVVPFTAITAWWNIQIRFAASKEEAMKVWKKTVSVILNLMVLTFQIWNFLSIMNSKEPLTRVAVANMITAANFYALVGNLRLQLLPFNLPQTAPRPA